MLYKRLAGNNVCGIAFIRKPCVASADNFSHRHPHQKAKKASNRIAKLAGITCEGRVKRIAKYGAFVELLKYECEGLVHISEIADRFVVNVRDYVGEEQLVWVKVVGEDSMGRLVLSLKQAEKTGYARVVALGGDGGHPWNDDGKTKWAKFGLRSAGVNHPWEPDPRLFTFDHASIRDPRPKYGCEEE